MLTGFSPDETIPFSVEGDAEPKTVFRLRALSDGRFSLLKRRASELSSSLASYIDRLQAATKRREEAKTNEEQEAALAEQEKLSSAGYDGIEARAAYHREAVRWGCAGHSGGAGGLASCSLVEVDDGAGRKVKVLSDETLSVYERTLVDAERQVGGKPELVRTSLLEVLAEAVMHAQRLRPAARRELPAPRVDAPGDA